MADEVAVALQAATDEAWRVADDQWLGEDVLSRHDVGRIVARFLETYGHPNVANAVREAAGPRLNPNTGEPLE